MPIVMMDHPITILAVWPAWSAPRYCRMLDGVEAHEGLSQGSASTKSSCFHTVVIRVGDRRCASGRDLGEKAAAEATNREATRMVSTRCESKNVVPLYLAAVRH